MGQQSASSPAPTQQQQAATAIDDLSSEFRRSISEARRMGGRIAAIEYINKIRSGGDWDYKSRFEYRSLPDIEAFGNFAFGATTAAWLDGFSGGLSNRFQDLTTNLTLRGAGAFQEYFQSYDPSNGHWYDKEPPAISNYGDSFEDQINIGQGIRWYFREGSTWPR
jgi:hypothetical protein